MSGNMPPLSPGGAAWLNSLDLIHVYCGRRESEHPHGRLFGPGPCGFPKKEWPELEFRTAAVTGRDAEREQIALAYSGRTRQAFDAAPEAWRQAWFDDTEALLPVVDRIANERAAAELEAAGSELHVDPLLRSADFASYVKHKLDGRAAALRASNGEGTTT